jgi:hypothetical protein
MTTPDPVKWTGWASRSKGESSSSIRARHSALPVTELGAEVRTAAQHDEEEGDGHQQPDQDGEVHGVQEAGRIPAILGQQVGVGTEAGVRQDPQDHAGDEPPDQGDHLHPRPVFDVDPGQLEAGVGEQRHEGDGSEDHADDHAAGPVVAGDVTDGVDHVIREQPAQEVPDDDGCDGAVVLLRHRLLRTAEGFKG